MRHDKCSYSWCSYQSTSWEHLSSLAGGRLPLSIAALQRTLGRFQNSKPSLSRVSCSPCGKARVPFGILMCHVQRPDRHVAKTLPAPPLHGVWKTPRWSSQTSPDMHHLDSEALAYTLTSCRAPQCLDSTSRIAKAFSLPLRSAKTATPTVHAFGDHGKEQCRYQTTQDHVPGWIGCDSGVWRNSRQYFHACAFNASPNVQQWFKASIAMV